MTTIVRLGRALCVLAAVLAVLVGQPAFAKGRHTDGAQQGGAHATQSHSGSHAGQSGHAGQARSNAQPTSHANGGKHGATKAVPGVKRDAHGKIARSSEQRNTFKKSHPCPSTGKSSGACPGYVIDHVVPLKRGGADQPSNMQWQTKAAAKEKDKTE
jgi:hypothetical protein